jgi:hypothetical protein
MLNWSPPESDGRYPSASTPRLHPWAGLYPFFEAGVENIVANPEERSAPSESALEK